MASTSSVSPVHAQRLLASALTQHSSLGFFHASLRLTKLWGAAHASQREDMAESSVKNLSKTEQPDSAKVAL